MCSANKRDKIVTIFQMAWKPSGFLNSDISATFKVIRIEFHRFVIKISQIKISIDEAEGIIENCVTVMCKTSDQTVWIKIIWWTDDN